MQRYLVRFAQIKEDFRLDELRSICSTCAVPFPEADTSSYSTSVLCLLLLLQVAFDSRPFGSLTFLMLLRCAPFLIGPSWLGILCLKDSRALFCREIVELIGEGCSLEVVLEATRSLSAEYYRPYQMLPFRFDVDDYMRKISMEEQVALINKFAFMPLEGPVSMSRPGVVFSLHCDAVADHFYFGRLIGVGRRDLIDTFNLKKRGYLGTTSMDAELSLVMSNFAHITNGSLVYDPFVGTGSLLCTAAFFGAYALGSDIDGRQLRGSHERSIASNMQQYRVEGRFVGGLVFDVRHHPWRRGFQVDAIITDPPYGVRAGAKKIGTSAPYPLSCSALLSPQEKADRYPKTIPYEMDELAEDLHRLAVTLLREGGRLVYWFPVEVPLGEDDGRLNESTLRSLLPVVKGLVLICVVPQRCRMFDRWLVVFEKRTLLLP